MALQWSTAHGLSSLTVHPRLVAFDLDGTVWTGYLNEHEYGKKGWVSNKKEDSVVLASITADKREVIKDKLNPDHKPARVIVAKDFVKIVQDLRKRKVAIAIASKNTNKAMCIRALWHIKFQDPVDKKEKRITDVLNYVEIAGVGSKVAQFKKFEAWLSQKCTRMLLFDDKAENMDVEQWAGATFFKIADRQVGITWQDYQNGIRLYNAHNSWRTIIPLGRSGNPKARHIGYVGADRVNAERYARGERRTPSDRASRWGFAMYVADDPRIAMHFAKAGREGRPDDQFVVKLYVRDYPRFMLEMTKVWLPEKGSWQIDNMHLDQAKTAERQAELDEKVQRKFQVKKPYLAFSRHHHMKSMSFLKEGERFNELVIYPQLQDAMFFGEFCPIATAEAMVAANDGNWKHQKWHLNIQTWGIKMIDETKDDFKKHGETWK